MIAVALTGACCVLAVAVLVAVGVPWWVITPLVVSALFVVIAIVSPGSDDDG